MNKAMAVLPYGDQTQLDNQAILQALKNLVLAVAEPPVAPMIRPRDSEDYATQSTHPSQITHDDPFAPFATQQPYSPDLHVQADDIPLAQATLPPYHEWHMKCLFCPCKIAFKFSSSIFMTDLLPKDMYSKKHPRSPDGASMTICPTCLLQPVGGSDTHVRAAEIFHGFKLDEPSVVSFEALTALGHKIPLIKSESKVLFYNSVAAMALIKARDQAAFSIIWWSGTR